MACWTFFFFILFSIFIVSEDPPRPPEGSAMCTDMAGYSAARGDFSVEYDNFAEMDICNMTFDPAYNEDEADKKLTEGKTNNQQR